MGGHDHEQMGKRGVSRPMMKHGDASNGGGMSAEDRRQMLAMHHEQTLWCYWTLILLGFWTIVAPLTFGYWTQTATLGREIWLSPDARIGLMIGSDILSGILLVVLGWRCLKPNRPISQWACCFVGIWLSLAPIVFWASTAAAYLNATIVGALVIALTVLIPGMPNMILYMKMGGDLPKGWTYNPSSWPQRGVMILLGFAGWLVSRYLAAAQFGFIDHAWDPFFGQQTTRVLTSDMSHTLPVSDAALGTLLYTFEFLMGWMGAPTRWRTMPWMVAFFGVLVIPLGLVHIFLVISQPVFVGAWCTFCLLAAAIMLPMLPLEVDEVIAMGQHVKRRVRAGESFWKVFWKGGNGKEAGQDERSLKAVEFAEHPIRVTRAALWGMSGSWWLVACSAIGTWLIFAPGVFGFSGTFPANIHYVGGSLIVAASVIAMGEPVRRVRYFNLPVGLGVAVLPWFFGSIGPAASILASVCGLLVVGLSIPRGPKNECYGDWDRYVT